MAQITFYLFRRWFFLSLALLSFTFAARRLGLVRLGAVVTDVVQYLLGTTLVNEFHESLVSEFVAFEVNFWNT